MAYVAKGYDSSSKDKATQRMLDAKSARDADKVALAQKMQNRTTVVVGKDERGGGG